MLYKDKNHGDESALYKTKFGRKHFAHKIMYPKGSLCRKNSLLKGSFAKGIAYFL